ncbi:3-deoxy-manno-octulosonate cytidylyltransferase [compost metagenome]
MSRVVTILQARMGSERLPGKSLRLMAGKPMVLWCLERLTMMRRSDALIVATSVLPLDDPLADALQARGYRVFRGSESDVLDRYFQCAAKTDADIIVRSTGDNPFVDPIEADRLIDFFAREHLDYACGSTDSTSGYPLGVSVEVMSRGALERAWREGDAPHHREHVNEYILEHPETFPQALLSPPPPLRAPGLSLTVDTLDDFLQAESYYREFLATGADSLVSVEGIVQRYLNTQHRHGEAS